MRRSRRPGIQTGLGLRSSCWLVTVARTEGPSSCHATTPDASTFVDLHPGRRSSKPLIYQGLTPASANNTSGVAPQRQPVRWTAPVGVGYSPGSRDRRPAARPARGSRDAAIHRARFMDLGRRDLVPSIAESGRGRVDPRRTATSGRHGGHRLGRTRRRSPNTTTRRRGLHKAGQVRRIGWPTSSLVCRR
jgi:hypothetical protein